MPPGRSASRSTRWREKSSHEPPRQAHFRTSHPACPVPASTPTWRQRSCLVAHERYDDGGVAGGSTRSPNDPGGEVSAANKGRKSTADWIRDEVLGGTKPAYKRGGRQRGYDAGGAAPPPPPSFNTPSPDFAYSAKPNPIVAMVQQNMPPLDRAGKIMAARAAQFRKPLPNVGTAGGLGNKQGGRIKRQQQRRYDDGGIADASPARPPALAFGDGPPAPPRISNDGTPIAPAPPRANDPSFVNRQTAAQKNSQLKQRVRQLEGKGR